MDLDEAAQTIAAADGYAYLGLCDEAWELLESLPPDIRAESRVFAVRLVVCVHLQRWEMGMLLARCIGSENPLNEREAAGRFRLAHAAALCASGDVPAARESIARMSNVWPEGRETALAAPGCIQSGNEGKSLRAFAAAVAIGWPAYWLAPGVRRRIPGAEGKGSSPGGRS